MPRTPSARPVGGRQPTRAQQDVSKVEGRKPVAAQPPARPSPGPGSEARRLVAAWPDASRRAAEALLDRYGDPSQATPSHLVWYKNGPWKRSVVYRDGVPHAFPVPHTDVVQQFVDYEPPLGKVDELLRFNGSLTVDRTRGEIACRCDSEATNILMLNLAHDVATEVRTFEEARAYAAEKKGAPRPGEPEDYLVGLMFAVDVGDVGDPDEAVAGGTAPELEADEAREEPGRPERLRRTRATRGRRPTVRRRPTTGTR